MNTKIETPTADALRNKIIRCGNWPQLAQHVANVIDTVAQLERENFLLKARVTELTDQARRRAAA